MRASRSGMRRGTMAAKGDRDAVTGVETTGHEWDGIRELNNPLPKWWVYTFYVSIAIAVVMWVLFPSWPTGRSYFPGLLRSNERLDFERRYAVAKSAQSQWTRPDRRARCRRDPGRPGACPVRDRRRREELQEQLRHLPWPRRGVVGLLPEPGRRLMDLGRCHRPDRAHHPARHPQRRGSRRTRQRNA